MTEVASDAVEYVLGQVETQLAIDDLVAKMCEEMLEKEQRLMIEKVLLKEAIERVRFEEVAIPDAANTLVNHTIS